MSDESERSLAIRPRWWYAVFYIAAVAAGAVGATAFWEFVSTR